METKGGKVLNKTEWLRLGIDWDATTEDIGYIKITQDIAYRVKHHGNDTYSVLFDVDGSNGQLQFPSKELAQKYLEGQINSKKDYIDLIGKKKAVYERIAPLARKMTLIRSQTDALIFLNYR